jgi:mono/diheme cytochrome c family protein
MDSARRLGVLAVAALAAVLAPGCSRHEEPDKVNGKALFAGKGTCGSCHVLRRANTQGRVGPNLDVAFRVARADGMTSETVEGIVYRQILHPRRNSKMPAGLVEGEDARDVAAYVGDVAGQPGQDTGQLAQAGKPKTSNKTAQAKGGQIRLDADPSGALAFTASKALAQAGMLEFVMLNKAPIQHNIAVKGPGISPEKGPVVGNGGESKLSVKLRPGRYEFFCSVPGHEQGGMKGTLTVR